ncbi:MAG TPA: tRNA (guanosine(37)-N1)-methyltransferase TrmD [Rectinemataceae bacterium]|nr:tRNA (guanosine(37)-N1)-methyltransferase TrmD [Rectinemataceae bacterium]
MKISVLTLFPEIMEGFFESSIMKRAVEKGLIEYELVNIRDYAFDKHHKCDDEVYGGGAGMLMLPGPLGLALEASGVQAKPGAEYESEPESGAVELEGDDVFGADSLEAGGAHSKPRTVFLTPSGRLLNQALAQDLAEEEHLVLICGRYEGIDQRIIDKYVDDEVSIGDYVLSSGEVAALVLVDAVYRLVPGVIKGESLAEESFSAHAGRAAAGDEAGSGPSGPSLLEYPQYTRPAAYGRMKVPDVLSSGHHAKIVRWRLKEQLRKTLAYRPELLAKGGLPEEALKLLKEISTEGGDT